jgi:two-component system cell cycle response regulator
MRGDELCHRVRSVLGLRSLPILFLSVVSEKKSIIGMFRSGATDYLVKPFAIEELLARVTVHLQNRRLTRLTRERVRNLRQWGEQLLDLSRDVLEQKGSKPEAAAALERLKVLGRSSLDAFDL